MTYNSETIEFSIENQKNQNNEIFEKVKIAYFQLFLGIPLPCLKNESIRN